MQEGMMFFVNSFILFFLQAVKFSSLNSHAAIEIKYKKTEKKRCFILSNLKQL
jgi:hypothetical protein